MLGPMIGLLINEKGTLSIVLMTDSEEDRERASRLYAQIDPDISVFECLVQKRLRTDKTRQQKES